MQTVMFWLVWPWPRGGVKVMLPGEAPKGPPPPAPELHGVMIAPNAVVGWVLVMLKVNLKGPPT